MPTKENASLIKYKHKLQEARIDNNQINEIMKLYSLCKKISYLFYTQIGLIVASIFCVIILELVFQVKWDDLTKSQTQIVTTLGSATAIVVFISSIFSIWLFVKVIISKSVLIKNKVKYWALFSLIPALGSVFFFILKWRIKHLV